MQGTHRLGGVLAPVAALLVATPALADITVGPAGSGAQYQQISSALAFAAPGETIRVEAGSYDPFVVTKGVTIIGAGIDQTIVEILPSSNDGAIDVIGVPAGQRVVLSSLSIQRNASSLDGRIEITDCDGAVHLIDVESLTPNTFGVARHSNEAVLRVENSDAVICEHCTFKGWLPSSQFSWMHGSPAVHAIGSRVWLNDCTLLAGHGSEGYGGPGIWAVDDAFVQATRCEVRGGDGGAHFGFEWWDIYGFEGEEAVRIDGSTVVLAGGSGNLVRGGHGNPVDDLNWSGGGPGVALIGDGILRRAPDAVIENGDNGNGEPSGGSAVVVQFLQTGADIAEPKRRTTIGSVDPVLAVGGPVGLVAGGEPGALHYAFVGAQAISPLQLPGLGQHVHLDAAQVVPLALIQLDGNGVGGHSTLVPNQPALIGWEFTVQSIDLDLTSLRISNPALLLIAP